MNVSLIARNLNPIRMPSSASGISSVIHIAPYKILVVSLPVSVAVRVSFALASIEKSLLSVESWVVVVAMKTVN